MSHDPPAIQDHYPDDFARCYGCGQHNEHGLQLRTWWEGEETVSRFTPAPYHSALPGTVYGGLVASLIDCHGTGSASAAALRREGREIGEGPSPRFVTAALHVDYAKPTPLGPELEIRGRIVELKERKVVVESMLSAEGVITARGRVVAVRLRSDMPPAAEAASAPEP